MDTTLFYLGAGAVFLFSLGVRQHLKSTYSRWSQVRSATGRPGGQVARIILDANRLRNVPVQPVKGELTDHYDPRRKELRLARDNFAGNSVAATAVSAHECGHALQDSDDYRPMEFRTAMVPIANAAARFGLPLAIFGSFYGSPAMVQIGTLGYVGSILLTFLTLPVEFDASKRALDQLDRLDLVSADGREGAEKVLKAAAMTYVAGVASSAWYLVYLVAVGGRFLLRRPEPPMPSRPSIARDRLIRPKQSTIPETRVGNGYGREFLAGVHIPGGSGSLHPESPRLATDVVRDRTRDYLGRGRLSLVAAVT